MQYTLDSVHRLINSKDDERIQLLLQVQTSEDISRLIDVVFDDHIIYVQNIIDDILQIFPDYRLNSRQTLYREIADYSLRNSEQIQKRMTELGIELLDDTGYMICNRAGITNIYCPCNRVIDSYSLNFLWINISPQDRAADISEHIFGSGTECNLLNKYIDILSRWREQNIESVINLWFDSALVTDRAYHNTVKLLNEINVQLRDIRSLSNIPDFIEASLHPITQLYYRVDILKILITDHMYSEDCRYTVISDMDVQPMTTEQLFDKVTIQLLDQYGYIYNNYSNISLFENSFSMFDTTNIAFRALHKRQMIDSINILLSRGRWFNHSTVFIMYDTVINNIGSSQYLDRPRKPVTVPISQFSCLCDHELEHSDYRKVKFRMNSDKSIEFKDGPRAILNSLREWIPVPLDTK